MESSESSPLPSFLPEGLRGKNSSEENASPSVPPSVDQLKEVWRQDERRFREMIDSLPEAIYTTDAGGHLTYFNPAAVEFSGREPELGSDRWCVTWNLYHPDGTPMPHEECPVAVAIKEGRSIRGAEAIAERPDGERVWFEAYPSPLRNDEGEVVGAINMLVDITERKRAEKQLRRNERELEDFFENASVGMHWVGPDGTILRVNQAELDLLGYSRDEYVGRHIADFYVDQDVIDDILQRLSAAEELDNYEARLRCKDGSIRHVLISSNVRWENGEFVHTRCVTRDITERKRQERLQKEQARLLEMIATGTPLEECLSALCKAVPRLNPGVRASILLADEQGNRFSKNIAPELGSSFGDGLEGAPINDLMIGTCGEAVFRGEPISCEDIASDDRWSENWRELCLAHGVRAGHSVPIRSEDGEPVGSFMLCFDEPRAPNEWEHRLADFGTHIASIALEREKSKQALRDRENRLASKVADMERLHTLSTRLLHQDDVETALHEVMTASAELLNADKAGVQIYDEQEDLLRLVSTLGSDQPFFDQFQTVDTDGFTPCAAALERREQVLVEDLSSNPDFDEFARAAEPYDILAALSVPLFGSEGQLFGVFTMYWNDPHRPSEDKLQLLDLYTQQARRQIERKRDAEILREREEHLSALVETSPECIKVVAADGTLLQMNPAGVEIAEADAASDMIGECIYDFIAPEHRESYRAFNEKICRGEHGTLEFDVINLEGERRRLETHAAPLRLSDGEIAQLAMTRDVTQRKKDEEALRESEKRLRLATEAANLGVFKWDIPNDEVAWENDRMYEIFRHPRDEEPINAARFLDEVAHPEDADAFEAAIDEALQTDHFHFVGRFRRGDGKLRWIELTGQVQRGPEGTPKEMPGIAADITERKQAKERLRDLNQTLEERVEERTRQVQELTYRLSMAEHKERRRIAQVLHDDLQQRLYGIQIKMSSLRNGATSEDRDTLTGQIEELEERMEEAIQSMRELSVSMSPPVLKSEGLAAAIEWLQSQMKERHGLEVELSADREFRMKEKEDMRVLLFRVIRELLFNVVKHADTDQAAVELHDKDGDLVVRVIDHGKGFDPVELEKRETEEAFGLAGARDRLRPFDGELEIDSSPGDGTCITVYLPLTS